MSRELQEKLSNEIKIAIQDGSKSAEAIQQICHDSVISMFESSKDGATNISDIVKITVRASIQELMKAGKCTSSEIAAIVSGALQGVKAASSDTIKQNEAEIDAANERLALETSKLDQIIDQALCNVREVATEFPDQIREDLEAASTRERVRFVENMELLHQTVKRAVQLSIERGEAIEQTVHRIAFDATQKALHETEFSANRTRRVAEEVLSAAIEATETANQQIREISNAASDGIREALVKAISNAHKKAQASGQNLSESSAKRLLVLKEEIENSGDLFVGALRTVAERSDEIAKETLHEIADDAQKAGSRLRQTAADTAQSISEQLRSLRVETFELGEKVLRATANEALVLGESLFEIAKGATSGMIKGSRDALNAKTKAANSETSIHQQDHANGDEEKQ
nr:DUF6781 family protein [uncultured Cohaesibacter sp.]